MNRHEEEEVRESVESPSAELIQSIKIKGIRLTAIESHTLISSPADAGDVEMELTTEGKACPRIGDSFGVNASVSLAIVGTNGNIEGQEPFVRIAAEFHLDYVLPEDVEATEEELDTFARVNGVFNAWPYFREVIQATLARMALPAVTIPVFRMPRCACETVEEESASSGSDSNPNG